MIISGSVAAVLVNEILSPPLYIYSKFILPMYAHLFMYICLYISLLSRKCWTLLLVRLFFVCLFLFRLSRYIIRFPLIIIWSPSLRFVSKIIVWARVSRNIFNNNVKIEYFFLFLVLILFHFCDVRYYIIYYFCFSSNFFMKTF